MAFLCFQPAGCFAMLGGAQRQGRAALPAPLEEKAEAVKQTEVLTAVPKIAEVEVSAVKSMKATEVVPTDIDDGASVSTANGDEGELSEAESPSEETEAAVSGEACPQLLPTAPVVVREAGRAVSTVSPASPELACEDVSVPAMGDLGLLRGESVAPEKVTPRAEPPRAETQLAAIEPPHSRVVALASKPSFQAAALGGAGGAVVLGASGAAGGSVLGAALGVVPAPLTLGLSIPVCSVLLGGAGGMVLGAAGLIGGSTAGSKVYEHREAIKESFIAFSNREDIQEGLARASVQGEAVKESLRAFASREDVQAGFARVQSGQELVKERLRAFASREDVQAGIARSASLVRSFSNSIQ